MNAKSKSVKKQTIASTCRSMIIAGRSDSQIWAVLRRVFKMDESKRYYITWYRCEVRRRGLTADRRVEQQPVDKDRRHSNYRYTVH